MESSSAPGVNIGNYKGVMLCNRPFNGVSGAVKTSNVKKSGSLPFVAGGTTGKIGQNVPILNEPHYAVKRDKSNTALSRHKKWLYELAKERERLEKALMEDQLLKEKKKKRFAEREAKMRASIRNSDVPETSNDDNVKKLPMWALTQNDADERVEREEEEEADDLIDFANNLDIDDFMDKVEMKATMDQMDMRMSALQDQVDEEEKEIRKQELGEQRLESKVMALNADNLARHSSETSSVVIDDDMQSVASTVLSECKSIRSVHSTRSMAVLTKRAKEKILSTVHEDNKLEDIVKPRVITHDEEGGTRISNKSNPSQLPYIHRNPAL